MDRSYKAKLVFEELDGFDQLESNRFHSGEKLKHHICKCMAAYLINDAGRDVAIECETENGEIDVLDLGESDEPARAIELETSYTPQVAREKYEQYAEPSELIEDVHTLPIAEAPDDLEELEEWLRERIPGV